MFFKIKNDAMFKAIFCNENNKDLLERLIKEAIDEDVEVLTVNSSELIKDNVIVKGKTLDVLVKVKNKEINIEVNSYSDSNLNRRNASYIFKRYTNSVNVGKTYRDMPDFIQINLSSNDKLPLKSIYTLYDDKNKLKYIDNLKIYEINVKKAKELWYTNAKEVSIIGLLDCEKEELDLAKGDELVEKIKKEVERLHEDKDFIEFLSAEDEERLFLNTVKQAEYEKGISDNKVETAKSMLQMTDDLNFISKATGLTLEEINNLK